MAAAAAGQLSYQGGWALGCSTMARLARGCQLAQLSWQSAELAVTPDTPTVTPRSMTREWPCSTAQHSRLEDPGCCLNQSSTGCGLLHQGAAQRRTAGQLKQEVQIQEPGAARSSPFPVHTHIHAARHVAGQEQHAVCNVGGQQGHALEHRRLCQQALHLCRWGSQGRQLLLMER